MVIWAEAVDCVSLVSPSSMFDVSAEMRYDGESVVSDVVVVGLTSVSLLVSASSVIGFR